MQNITRRERNWNKYTLRKAIIINEKKPFIDGFFSFALFKIDFNFQ